MASCLSFPASAPLFEEKWNIRVLALVADRKNPRLIHRSGPKTAFATNNDPVDSFKVDAPQFFQKGFNRKEADSGGGPPGVGSTSEGLARVFPRHGHPHTEQTHMPHTP